MWPTKDERWLPQPGSEATSDGNRCASASCAGTLDQNAGPLAQTRTASSGDGTSLPCKSQLIFWHEDITRLFHVTHFRGCAALFNKHTSEQDIEVKAIHNPTDKANCSGWALEAVISNARFRRTPSNGKPYTMMSLHCQNAFAKKRSIALTLLLAVHTIMWQEKVDTVAGDFSGASWPRRSGPQQQLDSAPEETFKNAKLPVPPGPSPLRGTGGVQVSGQNVGGFVKPSVRVVDTITWCHRNQPSSVRLVAEGPDLPPRSLDSPQPRQRTFGRAHKGINIPQAGPLPPADQKEQELESI